MASKANSPQQQQEQQRPLEQSLEQQQSVVTSPTTVVAVDSNNKTHPVTISATPILTTTATAAAPSTTVNAAPAAASSSAGGSSNAHQKSAPQMQHHSPQPPQQSCHKQLQQQHTISTPILAVVATSSSFASSSSNGGGSSGCSAAASAAQQTFEKLSRPAAFDKMESLVREMQDPENGVPVRQQKMFLTSIPYAFMGYDLIEWLMDRLLIEESEALNIANQLCLHGYFFPVNDTKTLVVKDDSSLYRFQTPYYWPWQHKAPDNVEYAIYLAKRSLRNKQRHGLEDYELEALSSLHKNLKGKWDIISMQAEEQVRLAKERKKGDKIVGDSQERAYWRVHRPPPGQFTPLEACPIPMRDRQGAKPKRKTLEDTQRELNYLKKTINRTRMKMSKACESLVAYAETFSEYDAFMQPPLPSNPWVTEDTTFWQLNSTYVDAPTEKRVRRWAISIEELVGDPTGLQEFTNFLEKEYSHENIRFWNEVNCLRRAAHSQVPRKATEIYEEFLMPGAPCEINIDSKTMANVLQALCSPSRFTFDSASEHIYTLLLKKDCYPRFIRSEHYKRLLENGAQPLHKKRFFNFGGVGGAKKKMTAALSGPTHMSDASAAKAVVAAMAVPPAPGSLARRRGSDRSLTGSAHELTVIGVNKDATSKVPHSHSQSNLSEMPFSASIYRGDLVAPLVALDDRAYTAHGIRLMCLQATQEAPKSKMPTRLESTAESGGGNAVCPWDLDDEPSPVAPAVTKSASSQSTSATQVPGSSNKRTTPAAIAATQVQLSVCPWEQSTADLSSTAAATTKIVPLRLNSTASDATDVTNLVCGGLQRTTLGIRHQNTVDSGETGMKRLMPALTEQRRASMSFTPSRLADHQLARPTHFKTISCPTPTLGSQIMGDTTTTPLTPPPLCGLVAAVEASIDDSLNALKEENQLPLASPTLSPLPSDSNQSLQHIAEVSTDDTAIEAKSLLVPQEHIIEEPIREVEIELIETTDFIDPCQSPHHSPAPFTSTQASLSNDGRSRSATPTPEIKVQEYSIAVGTSISNSNSTSAKSSKIAETLLHASAGELKDDFNAVGVMDLDSTRAEKAQMHCKVPPPLPPIGPMEEEQLLDDDNDEDDDEGSLMQEELSPTSDEYQEGLQFGEDGYIAPAPTPAPSIAPLAEHDVDTVDDEVPLEEEREEEEPTKLPAQSSSISTLPVKLISTTVTVSTPEEGKKRRKKRSLESKRIASLEEKEKVSTSATVDVSTKTDTEHNTVCPWEDENASTADGTFVKTYATLGYL